MSVTLRACASGFLNQSQHTEGVRKAPLQTVRAVRSACEREIGVKVVAERAAAAAATALWRRRIQNIDFTACMDNTIASGPFRAATVRRTVSSRNAVVRTAISAAIALLLEQQRGPTLMTRGL